MEENKPSLADIMTPEQKSRFFNIIFNQAVKKANLVEITDEPLLIVPKDEKEK